MYPSRLSGSTPPISSLWIAARMSCSFSLGARIRPAPSLTPVMILGWHPVRITRFFAESLKPLSARVWRTNSITERASSPEKIKSSTQAVALIPVAEQTSRIGSYIEARNRFAKAGLVGAPWGRCHSYVVKAVRRLEIMGFGDRQDVSLRLDDLGAPVNVLCCPRSSVTGLQFRHRFKQSRPHILMLHGSGERGIARVAGSISSVESRWVRFIQSGSELQPPW